MFDFGLGRGFMLEKLPHCIHSRLGKNGESSMDMYVFRPVEFVPVSD